MDPTRPIWPIYVIDFEASGLGELTYPIEIGIAWWTSPEATLGSWSTLIKPTEDWLTHRIWNPAGEAIHGIRREDLEGGENPAAALGRANEILGRADVLCDGGEHDIRWLRHLAHAARLEPTFQLKDWRTLRDRLSPPQFSFMLEWHRQQEKPHRAAADALLMLEAFAAATKL